MIITDIKSPGIDGHELLTLIRDNPSTKHILFFFTTGWATLDSAIRAKQFGADNIFDKPYDIEELITTLREVL